MFIKPPLNANQVFTAHFPQGMLIGELPEKHEVNFTKLYFGKVTSIVDWEESII